MRSIVRLGQRVEVEPAEHRVIEPERAGHRRPGRVWPRHLRQFPLWRMRRFEPVSRYCGHLNGRGRTHMVRCCGREDEASAGHADAGKRPDGRYLARARSHAAEPNASTACHRAATPRPAAGQVALAGCGPQSHAAAPATTTQPATRQRSLASQHTARRRRAGTPATAGAAPVWKELARNGRLMSLPGMSSHVTIWA
jgi:hypothetical protein